MLAGWQAGDAQATAQLNGVFDATLAGKNDGHFRHPAPSDRVHVSASLNLMTLTIMHRLYGLTSTEFYKGDPLRYVRSTLISRKLLGLPKLYLSWPVYAFTSEALGQTMMYPKKSPPGTDPEDTLVDSGNWRDVGPPAMNAGIPRLLDEMLDCYQRLTGFDPVLHLSAPYSLAADIFGQEALISELTHAPDFVNRFLDHLADVVHKPWIDHFLRKFPDGWVELSDASGSPFFIGPQNCKNMAIRSIQRLIHNSPWNKRIYVANYRGDYVAGERRKAASRTGRRSARKETPEQVSLAELLDLKHSVCRDFVIRLHDDRLPVSNYVAQAIKHHIPLFLGIGATQIDRNSIADLEQARQDIGDITSEYLEAIKTVAESIRDDGYDLRKPPWPGTIYFEDISAESDFELIKVIVGVALAQGAL